MEKGIVTLSLRMPEALAAQVKQRAEKLGISQNSMILVLLELGGRVYESAGYFSSGGEIASESISRSMRSMI